MTLFVRLSLCPFSVGPLAAENSFQTFIPASSATTKAIPPSLPPCLTTTRTIWSELTYLSLEVPLIFSLPWVPLGHCSRGPSREPSDLSGLESDGLPPWVAFGHRSRGPASPPSDLSGLDPDGPLGLHAVFSLSYPWASFVGWSLLILYCTLSTFCLFMIADFVTLFH